MSGYSLMWNPRAGRATKPSCFSKLSDAQSSLHNSSLYGPWCKTLTCSSPRSCDHSKVASHERQVIPCQTLKTKKYDGKLSYRSECTAVMFSPHTLKPFGMS